MTHQTAEKRLRRALQEIYGYWPDPIPLPEPGKGIDYERLFRSWQAHCNHLRELARVALEETVQ